jgi:hypothetical protein
MNFSRLPAVVAVASILLLAAQPARAGEAAAVAAPGKPELMVPSNPREAGARYGQAAGVALVCYGMRITGAPEVLKSKYQGEALAAFEDQAGRILTMWKDTLSCKKAGGPNQCRLSQAFSCAEAMKEIGPSGTKLPGLVEEKSAGEKSAAAPATVEPVKP